MQVLKYSELPHGGFAGLEERRVVMDSRVFGPHKQSTSFNGIANFVYLADANFLPYGETRMHPHKEIDVISIMATGNIKHEGSLEHGSNLSQGQAQVQRAGGEGFTHNEINPDATYNQMIQIWMLPDEPGQAAAFKTYTPKTGELTYIYGGEKNQQATLSSNTSISMINAKRGQKVSHQGKVMAYVSKGNIVANGEAIMPRSLLVDEQGLEIKILDDDTQIIFIYPT